MTLEFIEKRIKEQDDYLSNIPKLVHERHIDYSRGYALWRSAKSQLEYFESEKQKLIANEPHI